jgi:dipeptidyl aminopeptidase/acylaminoacyl peptidase
VDRDGSNQTQIIGDPAYHEGDPAWSPDGKQIAYDRTPRAGGRSDIYIAGADGSSPRLLLRDALEPACSPDGRRLAVAGTTARGSRQILVLATGSGERQLTHENNGAYYPAWSPDSSKIAFISIESGRWEVYVVAADGGSETRLTRRSQTGRGGGFVPSMGPAWSPNGAWIAFPYNTGKGTTISLMRPRGSDQHPILNLSGTAGTTTAPDSGSPDWQPAADLALTARAATTHRHRASTVTIAARLRNTAPLPARNARLLFEIRGPVALASATIGSRTCPLHRPVACSAGDIANNQTAVATVRLRVTGNGILDTRIRTTSTTADARPANNAARIQLRVGQ